MQFIKAFTLMETLVVLTIISIVMAVSFPALRGFYQRADADIVRLMLLRTIDFAKQEARARRVPVVLCKSNNQHSCAGKWNDGWLLFTDDDADGVVHDKNALIQIIQSKSHSGNIYFRSFPIYRDFLLFPASGMTVYDNATFWYCNRGDDVPLWAVIMNKSGKIHTLYPDADGSMKDSSGNILACT